MAGEGTSADTVPRRCLIADDEPRLRQVLARLMRADGFECIQVGNGEEALAVLEQLPVMLVLTDLRMPHMDGIELLRHVRDRYPDTVVVMITAVAEVEMAVRALSIGATDYLTKPFHLEEVRARVEQALEKRRLRLENRDYHDRLEDKVAHQARRIEEVFLAGIEGLVEALEVKDPYTHGHSLRVSQYSVVVGGSLGLDDEALRQIDVGGRVHDIGKIGVREAVLNKPGPLTDDEYLHIMTHPVVGWHILAPLLADAPVALGIVRSHHERFDGRGIPDGLVGDSIPIAARIAAVSDAFDAMTSRRPYRPGYRMSIEHAVDELRRHSGTQFDSVVLDSFLSALEQGTIDTAGVGGGDGPHLKRGIPAPAPVREIRTA